MSDIHQEWKDLRAKNGEFLNHLDCMTAKLEKKQAELKHHEQLQNLANDAAFAMQFIAPPPFNCCQDDRDILKALNKAQADRIETLEKEIIARKDQEQIDLIIKKDLDEKLDKATADYRALWVENENLKSQLASEKAQHEEKIDNAGKCYARLAIERNNLAETISNMEKMIRDLDERNGTLRERLANVNASLKKNIKETSNLRSTVNYLEGFKQYQAKEIKRLQEIVNAPNGSCSAYTQQGMQSKIAKQSNEIKRLTEENEILSSKNDELSGRYEAQKANVACAMEMWNKYEKETETLKKAIDLAAKDADANFERGKIKGMEEIWDELRNIYVSSPVGDNEKIFGYTTIGGIIMNLSPTWFINRAREYHEQETKDIRIGDEVEMDFSESCPDNPHSDIGIVIKVDLEKRVFIVVGPNFEGCFDESDIRSGNVRKTGNHFDPIPLDYFKK